MNQVLKKTYQHSCLVLSALFVYIFRFIEAISSLKGWKLMEIKKCTRKYTYALGSETWQSNFIAKCKYMFPRTLFNFHELSTFLQVPGHIKSSTKLFLNLFVDLHWQVFGQSNCSDFILMSICYFTLLSECAT